MAPRLEIASLINVYVRWGPSHSGLSVHGIYGHTLYSTWDILMQRIPKYRIHMVLRRAQCQAILSTMIVSDNDRGTESP